MGCGCKSDSSKFQETYQELNIPQKVIKFTFDVLLFSVLLPFVMVASVIITTYLLFKFLVLQETDLDITDGLNRVGKVLKTAGEVDEEEEDAIYFTPQEGHQYDLVGVDVVESKTN